MLSFKHAHRLGTIKGRVLDLDVELVHHVLPELGGEAGPVVGGDLAGYPMQPQPTMKEGSGSFLTRSFPKGQGAKETGGAAEAGKKKPISFANWQWAYDVYHNVAEPSVRYPEFASIY